MKRWTGEGSNRRRAVERGLAALGLGEQQVDIEDLGERTSGLLSMLGYRSTKIRLTEKPAPPARAPRAPRAERLPRGPRPAPVRADTRRNKQPNPPGRRDKSAAAPPSAPKTPRTGIAPEQLLAQWRDLLGWNDLAWVIKPAEGRRIPIELNTSRAERLAGAGGKGLESFEYLFNLACAGDAKDKPWITFNLARYPTAEERRLVDKALFAAFQVRRTGKPFRMDPASAARRRLIHQTLAHHADVATVSEGEGSSRRVVVIPKPKE